MDPALPIAPPDDIRDDPPHSGALRLAMLAAGPAFALVVYFLLGPWVLTTPLPEPARKAASVLTLMAIWWLGEALPLAVTALVPMVLIPALGITSLKEAAAPYADRLIFLFMGGFILALAMEKWNLHRRIALTTVSIVGTRPTTVILGFMIATAVLSGWMSNTATCVMMLPIGLSIIRVMKERSSAPTDNFAKCLVLGIGYAASIGGVATPIGSPPNAILLGVLDRTYSDSAPSLGFTQWLMFAVPFVALFIPLAWLVLTRLIYPVRLSEIPGGRSLIRQLLVDLGPVRRAEWLVMAVFAFAALAWMTREPLQLIDSLKPFLSRHWDDTSVAITTAILLFAIPVEPRKGIFLMDWRTASRMPWDVLLLFGGGLSLAAGLQASGLDKVIGDLVANLGGVHPLIVLLVIVTLSVFLSEVTSNTAQANILLPIIAVVAGTLGVNPLLLLIPATMALSCAFMMPMGTPPNALVFSSGMVTIRQMARAGFVLNLLTIALCILMAYTFIPWVTGARFGQFPEWAKLSAPATPAPQP